MRVGVEEEQDQAQVSSLSEQVKQIHANVTSKEFDYFNSIFTLSLLFHDRFRRQSVTRPDLSLRIHRAVVPHIRLLFADIRLANEYPFYDF